MTDIPEHRPASNPRHLTVMGTHPIAASVRIYRWNAFRGDRTGKSRCGNGSSTVEYTLYKLKLNNGDSRMAVDEQQLDDRILMARIAQGDEAALGELYDRYSRLVVSVAYHLLGRRDMAEDVTLEVFTRVWEKAHTYDSDRAQVNTWLTSMARNRAIDLLRRESARPEGDSVRWADLPTDPPAETPNPEARTQLTLQQQRVRKAVAALPQEQRDALALAYFQGMTHREIAETLDEPLGTIKGRIRAAMQKLRFTLLDEGHA